MSLADKVVLITGAARGLGFEYARFLGEAGARVVAGDIADCTAAANAAGNGAIAVMLDVTDIASADAMAELAMETLRPHRRADQQRGAVWLAARRTLQPDRRGRLGRDDGGERQGHLELLQGGGAGDASVGRRLDHQHRLARRHLWHAVRAALHHVQGGGDRPDARPRARARPRQHQGERTGAECRDDRGHRRILRRTARPWAGGGPRRPVDPAYARTGRTSPARSPG